MTTHNWDWYVTNHALASDPRAGKLYFLAEDDGEALNADKLKALNTDDLVSLMTWAPALQTWTYASSTTVYAAGNVTAIYSKGLKVKLTQTTTKYFYITSVSSYDAGNNRTTLTLYGGSSYSVANAAITNPFYSGAAVAIGFPEWLTFAPVWTNLSVGNGTLTAKLRMSGSGVVQVYAHLVYGSTTSISGAVGFDAPITPSGYSASTGGLCPLGSVEYVDTGSALYRGPAILIASSNKIELRIGVASGTYVTDASISATVPFTFSSAGSPDEIDITAMYMA